jgi:hypothetical protein
VLQPAGQLHLLAAAAAVEAQAVWLADLVVVRQRLVQADLLAVQELLGKVSQVVMDLQLPQFLIHLAVAVEPVLLAAQALILRLVAGALELRQALPARR